MPKVALYNKEGAQVGDVELSEAVFGQEPNAHLLHEVVQIQLANARQGTSDTKTRAEVSGGGRKPWRQKGTGRARQGSTRSPQWRHGGIVFGPHPRSFRLAIPKKARRAAIRQALSAKVAAGELLVLDTLTLEAPKTREVATMLKNLKVEGKAMLVTAGHDAVVYKSARNIPGVETLAAANINVYQVLKAGKLVLTKDAVAKVEEVFA